MIEFAWPWLWALAPLPFLVRYTVKPAPQTDAAIVVPFFARISTITSQRSFLHARSNRLLLWLATLVWLLLLAAAAKPQWVGEAVPLDSSARDLMLAVDISGSMKITDLTLNDEPATRLNVIKHIVGEFVAQRQGDRLGLILFGSKAYLQAPLTFDLATVFTLLNEAQIGMAGKNTAIGDAIGLAIKRLSQQTQAQRVLVLLSDGADNASEVSPLQAAELAAKEHIKIYTVAVGATEMTVSNFIFKQTVNPSQDLDEATLMQIAQTTGGQYFRAQSTEELQKIYATIAQLEPVKQDAQLYRPHISLLHYPLALAFVLSLLIAYLWHQGIGRG